MSSRVWNSNESNSMMCTMCSIMCFCMPKMKNGRCFLLL